MKKTFKKNTNNNFSRWTVFFVLLAFAACSVLPGVTIAAINLTEAVMVSGSNSKTYTTDADFDQGTLFNVNHDDPDSDKLQLNKTLSTFKVMWIANAGEDTVSKLDTTKNCLPPMQYPNCGNEIARYRMWFGPAGQPGHFAHLNNAHAGAAPSRTAVDKDGNVYVVNRHFDGRPAAVIKILATGGIDRNNNGVIDTSTDLNGNGKIESNEILPMADSNGNGKIDPGEIQDERIAWAVQVGPNGGIGRAIVIDPAGNLWVGLYSARQYYKLSSVDGSILAGPFSSLNNSPYGAAIDANGILYSALGTLFRLDTNNPTAPGAGQMVNGNAGYGITIANGKIYGSDSRSYRIYDPITNTNSTPASHSFWTYGVAADASGNIFVSQNNSGIAKFNGQTNQLICTSPVQPGATGQHGVIADGDGNVFLINWFGNSVSKYGPNCEQLGVFPIGNYPYTYSDATGLSAFSNTSPSGKWTVVQDGGNVGTKWGTVKWNTEPEANVPAGSSITFAARSADTQASLGSATFVPISNDVKFNLSGRFIEVQATLTANSGGTSPVLSDVTITEGNSAPVANNDGYTTDEDTPLNVPVTGVLSNDVDGENDSLTTSLISGPANAAAFNLNSDGSFSYAPNANFNGSDSFTYKVSDGDLESNTATVSITIDSVNDNPTAANDSATIVEDSGANQIDVLTNDSILPDAGETLAVSGVSQGANGSVSITNNGADVSYTPAADFFGADSFTYTVSDGNGGSATATVNVTVTGVNDAPVALNDAAQVNEDETLNSAAPGVIGNDSDIENSALTATLIAGPSSAASFTFNPDGSYSYTPNANFNGSDSFTYKVSDTELESNVATVTITVNAVNDAPTAENNSYSVNEDTALNTPAPGVVGNDSDVENSSLTAVLVSGPANAASFTLNADGSFSYTPASNFNGSDSFTYKASDSGLESNTATVSITVNAVNDAPAISGATVARQQAASGTVSTIATISDVDNSAGSLAFSVTSLPQGISVTDITNNNGTISATVAAGCAAVTGANQVGLKVIDADGAASTGVLTVNVTKETTAPVFGSIINVSVQLPENSTATSMPVNFAMPLASDNCSGPVAVVTNPVSGSVFPVGTTTVQVTATDQAGNQTLSIFTVTVQYRFSMVYYSDLLLSQQMINQVTAGSNLPVRFSLSGNKGANPYSQAPTSQPISCSTLQPIGAATEIDRYAPDPYYSSLYDFYQTTWRTQSGWKFTCRRLTLYLNDGTTRSLNFYFK